VLLTRKRRTIPSRLLSLIETAFLIAAGFLLYYYWVVPEAPSIEGDDTAPPPAAPAAPEEPAQPPPAAVRDRYEFAGGEVFFDDAVEPAFVALADRAKVSLSAVTYTIDRCTAVEALERAAARGVAVSAVAGRGKLDRRPSFPFLELHPSKGILHEKFLVADGATVLLSSRNMTGGQSKNAAVLFHRAPRLVELLAAEIAALQEMRVEKRCERGCPVEHGTLYFLPGKGCLAAKETLLSAREEVEAGVYTMTLGTPLMTGLKKGLRTGRKVSAILDDWSGEEGSAVNRRAGLYLEGLGAEVIYDRLFDAQGNTLNFHHKFAVIDDGEALVFGSMNWTKSACYRNREILFITRDGDLAGIFKTYFDDIKKAVGGGKAGD